MAALMKNANNRATVESSVAKRMASRLDDGRVQVEVVRHDRGAQNADGDIQHHRIGHDL